MLLLCDKTNKFTDFQYLVTLIMLMFGEDWRFVGNKNIQRVVNVGLVFRKNEWRLLRKFDAINGLV